MVPPGGIRGGRPRMRGDAAIRPKSRTPDAGKQRVLFVCMGNSCRSQMAEAFARAYGSDILAVHSAGLVPSMVVAPLTRQVLAEKNIPTEGQFPKGLELVVRELFDVVVNMSGERLPIPAGRMIEWTVRDPIGQSEEVYRAVAAQIEGLVMRLILELRPG